ncbi:mitochondrial protein C2orf69 homolog [Plutella xylostella]|uniref:mitochondrial protein C2orf69 homolog n=1 Tax=Plutella xylostella TaxID=51655 RepID=UPI002032ADEE|nr:mitochondrial protein C2orf69 homolog [Plutella xylostella]
MRPLRLRRVAGLGARFNDVLYQPPARVGNEDQTRTLVFFGGDVQDYPEVMLAHRDNRHYAQYSLDAATGVLAEHFPKHHVCVVRPSRIEYKSFSCYDNFVPSNNAGVPDHTPSHSALEHLERLLQEVGRRLQSLSQSEMAASAATDDADIEGLKSVSTSPVLDSITEAAADKPPAPPWLQSPTLHTSALTLVGFSKGCVVLNQLVHEFHHETTRENRDDSSVMRFMERIKYMYWLDGGHAGGRDTWLTSRPLLETLGRLNVTIYVHVSPYQVEDPARPWIGREEKAFTGQLRKLGANISRYLHPTAAPSLHSHFAVLADFKRVQDAGSEDKQ